MKHPVTILSGFLGSGKTTLLNHLLQSEHGLRIAVMVNDFGEVGIDKDLIEQEVDQVVELAGGCLCCTIRGDLLEAARTLLTSGKPFDYLVIETSGMAEPSSVAQTFLVPELEESFRLDAVITVVDASNVEEWCQANQTAVDQIRCADLLIVNKLDLVTPDDADRVRNLLTGINQDARVLPAMNAQVPLEYLLDIEAHRPERIAQAGNAHEQEHHDHDHGHEGSRSRVESASFTSDEDLDYDAFDQFLQELPDGVFRAKGIVALRGLSRRVIFHRVGGRNVLDQGAPWGEEGTSCRAVFIGQGFDKDELLANLHRCIARKEASLASGA